MRITIGLLILWGTVLIAGCQPTPANPGSPLEVSPTGTQEPIPAVTGEAQMTPSPSSAGLQLLIENTMQDLADRLTIPADQIVLVETTEVEWSDSSLDCPQPEMEYIQVITPGYRIVLQANDQLYEYHTNRDGYFVYCEDPNQLSGPKP